MSRPRQTKNKGLPTNLYWDKLAKQFRYRRPDNGKYTYMGSDRPKASMAAKKLNSILMGGEELVSKVLGEGQSLKAYINERFIKIHLPERELADETLTGYMRQIKHINKGVGDEPLYGITIKKISDFLSSIDGARQSNKYRSLLGLIFDYAKGEGYIDKNPAKDVLKRKVKKQRQRLSVDGYEVIHQLAGKQNLEWLQDAMDFGLITLQRREEVSSALFDDIKQEIINGQSVELLKVIQKKTKKHGKSAYIKIIIKEQLQKLIQKRRETGIYSPFIIHKLPKKIRKSEKRKHHTQILPDYISREFARVRDETGFFDQLEKPERPTFHEIRSLGIKLHEDDGNDAQALAGHTNRQMTENYKKGHEVEWTYANASDVVIK